MFAGVKLGAASTTEMKTLPGWALRMGNAATTVNWQTTGQDWSLAISLNLKTDWGYLGYRTGYLTPTAGKGLGVARYYANKAAALTESGTDNIAYFVNGSDNPLQLAAAQHLLPERPGFRRAQVLAARPSSFRPLAVERHLAADPLLGNAPLRQPRKLFAQLPDLLVRQLLHNSSFATHYIKQKNGLSMGCVKNVKKKA